MWPNIYLVGSDSVWGSPVGSAVASDDGSAIAVTSEVVSAVISDAGSAKAVTSDEGSAELSDFGSASAATSDLGSADTSDAGSDTTSGCGSADVGSDATSGCGSADTSDVGSGCAPSGAFSFAFVSSSPPSIYGKFLHFAVNWRGLHPSPTYHLRNNKISFSHWICVDRVLTHDVPLTTTTNSISCFSFKMRQWSL